MLSTEKNSEQGCNWEGRDLTGGRLKCSRWNLLKWTAVNSVITCLSLLRIDSKGDWWVGECSLCILNYCVCVFVIKWFQRPFWKYRSKIIIFARFDIKRGLITTQLSYCVIAELFLSLTGSNRHFIEPCSKGMML